uniref:Dioxygenase n=1 Tax=Lotharella globosa TaxID=91324 RepID=A0A7S3Z658_9EUKA
MAKAAVALVLGHVLLTSALPRVPRVSRASSGSVTSKPRAGGFRGRRLQDILRNRATEVVAEQKASSSSFWESLPRDDPRSPPPDVQARIVESPWRGGLEPCPETTGDPAEVIGKIPEALDGVLYRNGAGRIRVGSNQYGHWFDGDGFVSRLSLDPTRNQASLTCRYVRTDRYQRQEGAPDEAGFRSRGAWTQREGGALGNMGRSPTNPANTSPLSWNGKLLALCEGGPPIELDPESLETIGEYRMENLPKGAFFSAHPKEDHFTTDKGQGKTIFNNGLVIGPPMTLRLLRATEKEGVTNSRTLPMSALSFVHDFALTERYGVIFLNPYTVSYQDLLQGLVGTKALGMLYKWRPEDKTRIVVFDKETLEVIRDFRAPAMTFDHVINGYDLDEDRIRVQLLLHPSDSILDIEKGRHDMYQSTWTQTTLPTFHNIDITLGSSGSPPRVDTYEVSPLLSELPQINPRYTGARARWGYVNALKPLSDGALPGKLNAIGKIDLETGEFTVRGFGDHKYADEPIFVPKANAQAEDDGYLLTYVYDTTTHKSEVYHSTFPAPTISLSLPYLSISLSKKKSEQSRGPQIK